jgi:hypothetical protein
MTRAAGSDAGKSPKSKIKSSVLATPAPTTPDPRGPRNGLAYSRSFTQQSRGVPPRDSHASGSTQGWPGGYHTTKVHRPEVDPPVLL